MKLLIVPPGDGSLPLSWTGMAVSSLPVAAETSAIGLLLLPLMVTVVLAATLVVPAKSLTVTSIDRAVLFVEVLSNLTEAIAAM